MSAVPLDDQTRKRIDTLRAQAALLGATLVQLEDDFGLPIVVLTRWWLTRSFRLGELDELEALLRRMGGPTA